jgi:FAD-dependent urate hydroxylase
MGSIDVAIIGAGPYGLSLAAHLRAKNVQYRQFGIPMRLWRSAMPQGMYLKSEGMASNLSDPGDLHTLEAFCQSTGRSYADSGLPVPLSTFVAYGQWFQSELGLAVEESLITNVVRCDDGFELTDSNGNLVVARRVVAAIGVEHFARVPEVLSELPTQLCTHSSAHSDLASLRDREVVIVGVGQSGLELAGLLHENGAGVTVLARRGVAWNSEPHRSGRPLLERLKSPQSGLGHGWRYWAYSNLPDLYHRLPSNIKVAKAWSTLGPSGAPWLRSRVEGQVPILTGHSVEWAKPVSGLVRLGGTQPGGSSFELAADHVIAATGYRPQLNRLTFLSETIRAELRTVGGSPVLGPDFQSSVSGLYFIGAAAAASFGPVSRFVYGSKHAATSVARRLASGSRTIPGGLPR